MSIKSHIISALLRVYPARWRTEYGAEFSELLLRRGLTAGVAFDVVWNGICQRVRAAGASTILGMAMMLFIVAELVWNVSSPGLVSPWTNLLQDSSMTFPRIVVKLFRSDLYALLLMLCGCWTYLRHRGTLSTSGKAAIRASFLAGAPITLAGLLMMFGFLRAPILSPAGTFESSLNILLAPVSALPQAWLWGVIGGGIGRWISPLIRRPLASE